MLKAVLVQGLLVANIVLANEVIKFRFIISTVRKVLYTSDFESHPIHPPTYSLHCDIQLRRRY